jgi:hypothetical protein
MGTVRGLQCANAAPDITLVLLVTPETKDQALRGPNLPFLLFARMYAATVPLVQPAIQQE